MPDDDEKAGERLRPMRAAEIEAMIDAAENSLTYLILAAERRAASGGDAGHLQDLIAQTRKRLALLRKARHEIGRKG